MERQDIYGHVVKVFLMFLLACPGLVNANAQPPSLWQRSFEENKGQLRDQNNQPRPDILFFGESLGLAYHIRNTGISYQLSRVESWKPAPENDPEKKARMIPDQIGMYRIDLDWVNANRGLVAKKGKACKAYSNYYQVAAGEKPALRVRNYEDLYFEDVWNGVDLHYYQRNGVLESDWLMEKAADYEQIRFQIDGATLRADEEGYLIISTPFGEIREGRLEVYQGNKLLQAQWIVEGNQVRFFIEGFNADLPLRIDPPTRIWGTYYGGSGDDVGREVCADKSGNSYVAGATVSTSTIASSGAHQTTYGGGTQDALLAKFSSQGALVWATYYGGSSDDEGTGCSLDSFGNIYLLGWSSSDTGISTSGVHQVSRAGLMDVFLVKFDLDGIRKWGTYCGGTSNDQSTACAIDFSGKIVITGYTISTNGFASTGAHKTTSGGSIEAFLVKFDSNGSREWGTFYGGSNMDFGRSCTVDSSGNIFLAGMTGSSSTISTSGSYQVTLNGSRDIYLVKFDASGTRLWATYYGGSSVEALHDCAVDASGNIYITGVTESTNGIATNGSHKTNFTGMYCAFLTKFSSTGARIWGTYYGGEYECYGYSCAIDAAGNIILIGETDCNQGIVTSGAYQTTKAGDNDIYIVKFNGSGVRQWGTYYGGPYNEYGYSCALDPQGNILITGEAASVTGIASVGSYQENISGGWDAFLLKLDPIGTNTISDDQRICYGAKPALLSGSTMGYTAYRVKWLSSSTDSLSGYSAAGMNDTSINFQPANLFVTRWYKRIVVFNNVYDTSDFIRVEVTPLPDAAIFTLGPVSFCEGSGVVLKASMNTGLSYRWLKNQSVISGAKDTIYYASSAGNYQLVLTDSFVCVDTSDVLTIRVNPLPQVQMGLSNDSVCKGKQLTFTDGSSISLGSLSGRTWFFADGSEDTAFWVSKSFGTAGAFTVKLRVWSDSACVDSSIKTIQVVGSPVVGAIGGQSTGLIPGESYVYTVGQQAGNTYFWRAENGTLLSGQGTRSITVKWDFLASAYLSCGMTNALGCLDSSVLNLTMDLLPQISGFSPVIAAQNDTVRIYGFNLNGSSSVKFGGVNAQSFMEISPKELRAVVGSGATGEVSVVTPQGTANKANFIFGNPSGMDQQLDDLFLVYPNPATNTLIIHTRIKNVAIPFRIFESSGKLVMEGNLSENSTEINVEELARGVYIILFNDGTGKGYRVMLK